MTNIVKIGTVELTADEAFRLYENHKYIVTYSKIYQLFYSQAQQCVYGRPIYESPGLARRGRFHTLTGAEINRLLGVQLVNE